jgi:WD40 repeat protein
LEVTVHNKEFYSSVEPIACGKVSLEALSVGVQKDQWIVLDKGQLHVSLMLKRQVVKQVDNKGKHFMAVRPWAGSIFAPADYKAPGKQLPKQSLDMHHVYGYRARNCRSNVALFDKGSKLVYHTAAVGVVQAATVGTQQSFFRGHGAAGILDMALDATKQFAATGDALTNNNDKNATVTVMVWALAHPEQDAVAKLDCGRGMHSIAALAFSAAETPQQGSKYLLAVGTDNEHTVAVFDWRNSNKPLASISGHSDKVLDIVGHPTNPHVFVTLGVKHIKFWQFDPSAKALTSSKGVFGKLGSIQTLLCGGYCPSGEFVTGTMNGEVYHWDTQKREVVKASPVVHAGGVFALDYLDGHLVTAGKDGKVVLHKGTTTSVLMERAGVSARALAVDGGVVAVGFEDSNISLIKNGAVAAVVDAHSSIKDAELWGLAAHPTADQCATASQDGQVMTWNLTTRQLIKSANLNVPLGAVCYSPSGANVAVTSMANHVFILDSNLAIVHQFKLGDNSTEAVKPIKYSPNGQYIAASSFSTEATIDVYAAKDCTLVGKCKGHASRVSCMDWSSDSHYLQSNSVDHELLFCMLDHSHLIDA